MTSSPATSKSQLGRFGEAVAARYLTRQVGMCLLDRNWRCKRGEIDLVLRDHDLLVVCEVKTRASLRYGHPIEQVSPAKLERLKVLAGSWCESHDVRPEGVRIDVVGVLLRSSGPAEITHSRGWGW